MVYHGGNRAPGESESMAPRREKRGQSRILEEPAPENGRFRFPRSPHHRADDSGFPRSPHQNGKQKSSETKPVGRNGKQKSSETKEALSQRGPKERLARQTAANEVFIPEGAGRCQWVVDLGFSRPCAVGRTR